MACRSRPCPGAGGSTAWAGVTLPQQKRSRGAGAGGAPAGAPAPLSFTPHVDEEFAAEADEPSEAPPPPEQTARSLRLQLDGPTTSDASARLFERPLERFGSPRCACAHVCGHDMQGTGC